MLPLDDPRWATYDGGYRTLYDASILLRQLLSKGPTAELWDELWQELHHQGDVDQASYAAVPWLVEYVRRSRKLDWNALSLIALIELERPKNPKVRKELSVGYSEAIRSLPAVLGSRPEQKWSERVMQPAVACIALARGQRWLAKAYYELDRDTARNWFTEEFRWDFGED